MVDWSGALAGRGLRVCMGEGRMAGAGVGGGRRSAAGRVGGTGKPKLRGNTRGVAYRGGRTGRRVCVCLYSFITAAKCRDTLFF